MPEPTDPAAYCTRKPTPGAYLSDGCPDCGHAIVLHVGVDHCPVCETVDLNRQMRETVRQVRRLLDPREREREAFRLGTREPLPWRSTERTDG